MILTACIRYRGRLGAASTEVYRDSGDVLELRELEDALRTRDRDHMVSKGMELVGMLSFDMSNF